MATRADVIRLHAENPNWSPTEIAEALDCKSGYVRATAQRCGLKLPRAHRRGGRPAHMPENPNSLLRLGKAARAAGLTVADIEALHTTKAGQNFIRSIAKETAT